MDWNIVQGDCADVMGGMEAGSANLVFADPPYNIGVNYGDHYYDDRPEPNFLAWCGRWLSECHRVLADDGTFWLLVNHEWAWKLCPIAHEAGFRLRQWVTWYETFGVNMTRKYNRTSRPLLWFVRDPKRFTFNPEAVRRPSDRLAKYRDKRANPAGKLWDDVWKVPRLCGTHRERIKGFPTQLPLALLRPIVAAHSNPCDLVVDPFCGSATTGAACVELNRRFVGIELGDEFTTLARRRLENVAPLAFAVA